MTTSSDFPHSSEIALIYDRVNTKHGGAEQVLLTLHELFPEAPLFTSVYDSAQAEWAKVFPSVIPSFIQKLPLLKHRHRVIPFLMPLAFESFELSRFKLVISITSAEAKGVITLPNQLHVCYLLTPTRYLYSHRAEYLRSVPALLKPLASAAAGYLTWWDQAAAARPDHLIPISNLVSQRVTKYYRRSTEAPIYPPVAESSKTMLTDSEIPAEWHAFWPQPFLLSVCRLVEYKRVDLAIQASQKVGLPLVIVGSGPAEKVLKALSGENTHWLGSVSGRQLASLYNQATGVVMAGQEDFGITGLEAVQYGTPVAVHHQSGVAELIKDGTHGTHIKAETIEAVSQAIQKTTTKSWKKSDLKKQAKKYTTQHFKTHFHQQLSTLWKQHEPTL